MGANYGISSTGSGDIHNSGAVGQGAAVVNNHHQPLSRPGADATVDTVAEPADIGVITVLSEELRAVGEVLVRGEGYQQRSDDSGRVTFEANLRTGAKPARVVALQTLDRGQRSAALAFEHLRRYCAPPVVVLVGIAGGIHRDLAHGDVVISDEIVYYETRKETPGATLRRGRVHPMSALAKRMINEFFQAGGEPMRVPGFDRDYHVHRGPVGSGEAVVADQRSEIRKFLTAYNDKTLALETEAGGVAQAFDESADGSRTRAWFTIRGISDLADVDKADDWHDRAARHAAAVFERMVPYLLVNA